VVDGASHALAFLGGALGQRVVPLGVDSFGQSGALDDVYRYAGISEDQMVEAALMAVDRGQQGQARRVEGPLPGAPTDGVTPPPQTLPDPQISSCCQERHEKGGGCAAIPNAFRHPGGQHRYACLAMVGGCLCPGVDDLERTAAVGAHAVLQRPLGGRDDVQVAQQAAGDGGVVGVHRMSIRAALPCRTR